MAITPGRYVDTESFKQPTVVHGAVTLVPSLLVSDDAVFQPGVSALQLRPSLVTDTDTIRVNVVTRGPVSLMPSLFDDPSVMTTPMVDADPAQSQLLIDEDIVTAPFVVQRRYVRSQSVVLGLIEEVELTGDRDV